ncbi:uncharacterized protein DS421_4g117570 [Arachis hypogaea]|nr:uncharacterized protein DS421_4g117570 [Arachis hypogaea]
MQQETKRVSYLYSRASRELNTNWGMVKLEHGQVLQTGFKKLWLPIKIIEASMSSNVSQIK